MAIELEIRDGNPWWMSPDIWVVPGSDPTGPPGTPVAGDMAYLWAQVRNNGESRVENATVRFYWANPAVGVDRTTANFVGSANVTLDGGQVSDVLCLAPWQVVWVNNGHECVLAEAFHSSDPLPAAPAFNVPTDRHVAQRNLSVLKLMEGQGLFVFPFEIHNPTRRPRTVRIIGQPGELRELEPLIATLGEDFHWPDPGEVTSLGFETRVLPEQAARADDARAEETIDLPPGGRAGLNLVGQLTGGGALLHVLQLEDDQLIGGLSVLVLAGKGR